MKVYRITLRDLAALALLIIWLWYIELEAVISRLLFADEESIRNWRRGHHFGTSHGKLRLFGRIDVGNVARWSE